jgi:hypothetical protein
MVDRIAASVRERRGSSVDVHAGGDVPGAFEQVCDYRFLSLSFRAEARRRLLPHATAVFLIWPALSILFAGVTLKSQPLTAAASWPLTLLGLSAAALQMIPEFLSVGAILLIISLALFSGFRSSDPSAARRLSGRMSLLIEPFAMMLALLCGLALEYPALLHHPALAAFRTFSALTATIALFLALGLLLGYLAWRSRPALAYLGLVLLLVPAGWAAGLSHRSYKARKARPGTTVILGLDSISQQDDVSILRSLTREFSGTWYEKPVTPGLLTNSVWPSIIMHRPVHESGVFLIYQTVDWSRSPFQLVRRASESGCGTSSFFSDQFTTYVGATAGFDRVRSGPKGWLQLGTAEVKNGSIFLPIFLPLLPPIPATRTPANQSGTFAFDLRREIDAILTEGTGRCTFVAGHIDYLHQPRYPRYSGLTAAERSIVRGSRVEALEDLSLDWQFPVIPGDELKLYEWKTRRLQNILAQEIRATGFLEPSGRNRLVLFSDHGNRRALTGENFGRPQYHRVILATFGLPVREPLLPISLLDISELVGFPDPSRPGRAAPIVEYTNATGDEWRQLLESARLHLDGEISLDPAIVGKIGKRLLAYEPYAQKPEYFPAPTVTSSP